MRSSVLLLAAFAVWSSACERTAPAVPVSSSTLQAMREHAAHGAAMRDGVARGDLELARREALALEGLQMATADDHALDAMKAAAGEVAQAGDIPSASWALARVARACLDCHAASIDPSVHVGQPPGARAEAVPAMARHQWAAVRLWYGLIFPSSAAWSEGARALEEAPLDPGALAPAQAAAPEVVTLARSVRYLAGRAKSAASVDERVAVYGELMVTCSACHLRLGGGPPGTSAR